MNRLLTLIVLLVSSVGLTYPVVASADGRACEVMIIKEVVEPDGFVRRSVSYDEECRASRTYDPEVDVEEKPEILPALPSDPSGSFRVYDPRTLTTESYIPQPDGTLKVRPW